MPGRGYLPEVWLLGSSTFSAQLAGLLGLPFSFAFHFAPALVDEAVALYRSNFRRTGLLDEPHVMVAASVLCADTDEEARYLSGPSALAMLQLRTGRPGPVVSPEEAAAYPYTDQERAVVEAATADHVVGDPDTVQRGLAALVAAHRGRRAHAVDPGPHLEARARSLTLVAERWGCGRAAAGPADPAPRPAQRPGHPGQHLLAQQGQVVQVGQVEHLEVGPAGAHVGEAAELGHHLVRACRTVRCSRSSSTSRPMAAARRAISASVVPQQTPGPPSRTSVAGIAVRGPAGRRAPRRTGRRCPRARRRPG